MNTIKKNLFLYLSFIFLSYSFYNILSTGIQYRWGNDLFFYGPYLFLRWFGLYFQMASLFIIFYKLYKNLRKIVIFFF